MRHYEVLKCRWKPIIQIQYRIILLTTKCIFKYVKRENCKKKKKKIKTLKSWMTYQMIIKILTNCCYTCKWKTCTINKTVKEKTHYSTKLRQKTAIPHNGCCITVAISIFWLQLTCLIPPLLIHFNLRIRRNYRINFSWSILLLNA